MLTHRLTGMLGIAGFTTVLLTAGQASATLLVDEGFGPGYNDDATIYGLSPSRTGFDAADDWSGSKLDGKADFFHRAAGLESDLFDGETAGHVDGWVDNLTTPPNGAEVARNLDYSYSTSGDGLEVWGGFLFRFDDVEGELEVRLLDGTGNDRHSGFLIEADGAGGGTISTTWSGSNADNFTSSTLTPGETYAVFWRWVEDEDTFYDPSSVWFNPSVSDLDVDGNDIAGGEHGEAITLNQALDTDVANPFGGLEFSTDSFNGSNIEVDEFRMGESLADLNVVPEPGSLALLGLGGLAMLRRRRTC